MVQILQPDNTAATQRQLALEQLQQGLAGLAQMQQTKRAQALADQNAAMEYRKAGYDVSPEMIAQQREQTLNPELLNAQGPGVFDRVSSFFTGKEAVATPGQEKVDLFGKRTQEYQDRLAMEQAKVAKELENQAFDRRLKEQQLATSQAEMKRKGYESQRDFELKKQELAIKAAEAGTPENKLQIAELAKKQAGLYSVKQGMDTALKQLSDPKVSEVQKIKVGQGLLKLLNSAEGSDAVGAEEAKRIGSFLENKIFNITQPGSMFGRDMDEFTKQVATNSQVLGDRMAQVQEGIKALKGGAALTSVPGLQYAQYAPVQTKPKQAVAATQDMAAKAARLQELRAKAGK